MSRPEPVTWFAVCDAEFLMSYSVGAANEQQRAQIIDYWKGKICGECPTDQEARALARHELKSWLDAQLRNLPWH